MVTQRQVRLYWRPLAHVTCALPLLVLVLQLAEVGGLRLGPNPQLAIRDFLGEWGLRLLLVTLAMTPLRHVTGKPWPLQFRRLLGLWSFAYLALHFITYFFLDRSLDLPVIIEDDVLVTETSAEVLSLAIPKSIAVIEAIRREALSPP